MENDKDESNALPAHEETIYHSIVIGAGIAGLCAARTLVEAGQRVLVLEARERVGGRMHSELLVSATWGAGATFPVELGAEFVHGRPPELLALVAEADMELIETQGVDLCFRDGVLGDWSADDDAFRLLEELWESGNGEPANDISFATFLERRDPPEAVGRRAHAYVEGFNAADAERIGTASLAYQQVAEELSEGHRTARLKQGYSALATYLCERVREAGAEIRLGTAVRDVEWKPGAVVVTTEVGERCRAGHCIVTVPLGVLQAGAITFTPEPAEAMAAAHALSVGTVQRLVLHFKKRFWTEQKVQELLTERGGAGAQIRFLFTDDPAGEDMPTTWWTTAPVETPLLIGWVGGPLALLPEAADAELLVAKALSTLERIFGMEKDSLLDELAAWYLHDWQTDPYARGAYSYVPVGAFTAPMTLTHPVEDTLFFAGEHTDTTGHTGTVHGAMRSGLRAAKQVLETESASI